MEPIPTIPYAVATITPAQFRSLMWRLATVPDGARIAAFTAINKAALHARTLVAGRVADVTGGRITSVNKRIKVRKASRNRLSAQVRLSGTGISLVGFVRNPHAGMSPVRAKVFGTERVFPHAFLARGVMGGKDTAGNAITVGGGDVVAFERQGDKRLMRAGRYKGRMRQPLVALKGPSVAETFDRTPGLAQQALADITADFNKTLDSQVDWLLKRSQGQKAEAA